MPEQHLTMHLVGKSGDGDLVYSANKNSLEPHEIFKANLPGE